VSNVTLTSTDYNDAFLHWTNNSNDGTGFTIEARPIGDNNDADWAAVGTAPAGATSFDVDSADIASVPGVSSDATMDPSPDSLSYAVLAAPTSQPSDRDFATPTDDPTEHWSIGDGLTVKVWQNKAVTEADGTKSKPGIVVGLYTKNGDGNDYRWIQGVKVMHFEPPNTNPLPGVYQGTIGPAYYLQTSTRPLDSEDNVYIDTFSTTLTAPYYSSPSSEATPRAGGHVIGDEQSTIFDVPETPQPGYEFHFYDYLVDTKTQKVIYDVQWQRWTRDLVSAFNKKNDFDSGDFGLVTRSVVTSDPFPSTRTYLPGDFKVADKTQVKFKKPYNN
jgi:hypothetical protein